MTSKQEFTDQVLDQWQRGVITADEATDILVRAYGGEWPAELLVEDRNGLRTVEDGGLTTEWRGTAEELHSLLARRGYKRAGKQEGSTIGGLYVR